MCKSIKFNHLGKSEKIAQYAEIWIKNMCKRKNTDQDLYDLFDCGINTMSLQRQ
jgi:hypothetical protein